MCRELEERKQELRHEEIQTVYFGGGTPSVLRPEELGRMIQWLRQSLSVRADAEFTLEANPDDMTDDMLTAWRELGINRLSIGVQSFREEDLDWMNRSHSVSDSLESISRAKRAGFNNCTVDLMYGLPMLSDDEWRAHVRRVIAEDIPHVSAYCLTVERRTALAHLVDTGKVEAPGDEVQARQYDILVDELKRAGIMQYEVSNFSRPGFESRHNSAYWKGIAYLGIGPSAHSFNGRIRRWNVANNHRYMRGIEEGKPEFGQEELTLEEMFNERLLTGLRTRDGVDMNDLHPDFRGSEAFEKRLDEFTACGWVIRSEQRFFLSQEGMLRADYIASELFV